MFLALVRSSVHRGCPWGQSTLTDIVAVQEGIGIKDIRIVKPKRKTDGHACVTGDTVVSSRAGYVPFDDRNSQGDSSESEDGNECEGHGGARLDERESKSG